MKKTEPGKFNIARELIELQKGNNRFDYLNPYIERAKYLTQTGMLFTLEAFTETFPQMFAQPQLPLVLDIGCYMGKTVIELGKFNKGINVLGIDIRYKRVVKSCCKIERENLQNCKIAICDAAELIASLPGNSLAGAFIFFPDPWQKANQQKNRLLTRQFLTAIHSKLTWGGFIWLKTDNKPYYEQVLSNIKKSHFSIFSALPDNIAVREYKTLFEEMFSRQDKPIYQVILQKQKKGINNLL